jgi:epoxyqueuosine reductase QueG
VALSRKIIGYAGSLFDVAGTIPLPDKTHLLIVGLETTPERDLDEFHRIDGKFRLIGFEKHAKPRLESLLNLIHEHNFTAETIGKCGYPLKGEVNLKESAVRAGLGRWGKNTIVLHSVYGNRLRFMAIKTDAPLGSPVYISDIREENHACIGCSRCIESCPIKVLRPYAMPETKGCLANISQKPGKDGRLTICDICLRVCPANVDTTKQHA